MKARFLIPSLLLVAACGTAADDGASSNDDLTISPHGPGDDITFTLVVPAEVTQSNDANRFIYTVNGTTVAPNTPTRLPWSSSLYVSIFFFGAPDGFRTLQTFSATPGGTLRVELGAFEIQGAVPSASAIDLQLGEYQPSKTLYRGGAHEPDWTSSGAGDLDRDQLKFHPIPAFPNDYVWETNVGPARPFHVTAGQLVTVDETVVSPFATVRVEASDPAAFPDAFAQGYTLDCSLGAMLSWGEQAIGDALTVFTHSQSECAIRINGVAGARFTLGPREQKVIGVHRLEVDDVTLTDEAPGTKVHGQWSLSVHGARDELFSAETQTGVLLPPGAYDLVVVYHSLEGTPHRLTQVVNVP